MSLSNVIPGSGKDLLLTKKSLSELRRLRSKFPEDELILNLYARALRHACGVCTGSNLRDLRRFLDLLRALHEEFPFYRTVAAELGAGLLNASGAYSRRDAIARLVRELKDVQASLTTPGNEVQGRHEKKSP